MGNLISLDLADLEAYVLDLGEPRFRAEQIFQWIHGKGIFRPEQMQNLPAELRRRLSDLIPPFPLEIEDVRQARDGTQKFRFRTWDQGFVESVLIPERKRLTVCLSTQLGCRMGCVFCRTGGMGWKRNLDPEEILGQFYAIRALPGHEQEITHIVLMGMGEPLDNLTGTLSALRILVHPLGACFSPRRVTVSTVGLPDRMETLLREHQVSLTVSLNAADDETRTRLMPVNKRYPIQEVVDVLKRLPLAHRRRFSIAYVLIGGVNDGPRDVRNLVRLLHGIRCKVNLIPFNPFPGSGLSKPEEGRVLAFRDRLRSKGFSTHIRSSRGDDILAACGQLASDSGTWPTEEPKPRGTG